MVRSILAFLCCGFVSCSSGPVATAKGVWMGGAAMVKAKGFYASYDGPHGKIRYGYAETDQTVVPSKVLFHRGVRTAINATDAVVKHAVP